MRNKKGQFVKGHTENKGKKKPSISLEHRKKIGDANRRRIISDRTKCRSCHSKTNFNRDYWTNIFKKLRSI